MSKYLAALMLITCAMQAQSLFVPTDTLQTRLTEDNLFLYQGNKQIVELHTEPRGHHSMVEFRLEKDAVVMDLSQLKTLPKMPKVVIGWNNVGTLDFPALAYCIGMDISCDEDKIPYSIYFEGRTLDNRHYYKQFLKTAHRRRTLSEAIYDLPQKMAQFHCRFDFTTPNVFRIHDVHFQEMNVFVKPDTPRTAELLFHATFDNTTEAQFAKGNPHPTTSQNTEYVPGLMGQALYSSRTRDTIVGYDVPNNIQRNCGAISVWVNPQWTTTDNDGNTRNFRCFVSMAHPAQRHGSGAIWFWSQGARLRWDTSDVFDSYSLAPRGFERNRWYHLVMNWDENGSQAYINGQPAALAPQSDGSSPLRIASNGRTLHLVQKDIDIKTFYAGCLPGAFDNNLQADAYLDDLRIYSAPLSTDQISKLYDDIIYFQARALNPFVMANSVPFHVAVNTTTDDTLEFAWKIYDAAGKAIAASSKNAVKNAGSRQLALTIPASSCPPGNYDLEIIETTRQSGLHTSRVTCHVMKAVNPWTAPADAELKLQPVATIVPTPDMPAEQFASMGKLHMSSLNGRSYLETDDEEGSRFVVRAQLPDDKSIYMLEWDYPDDKARSVDIVAQSSKIKGGEYELQNGYLTGNEYYNTYKFITEKCLYFPRSRDIAMIFMTAREGKPAAIAEIRISKVVSGLPAMGCLPPPKINGWERTLGIYFEDPAINFDFGVNASSPEDFPVMVDRLVAYMQYSGQNMLTYPMVWYHGRIGDKYNPRNHVASFMAALLCKFDEAKLGFTPSFNWHNLVLDDIKVTQEAIDSGAFHDTPYAIWDTGKPNPGGWHGTPPNYNILHPRVQQAIMDEVETFIQEGQGHPSFKGITFHLTLHCLASFGNLKCGYNDYAIDMFSQATGIQVPVNRQAPMRGKDYADWLRANAWEQWIDFRCKELAKFYKRIADRLKDARPDLKLILTTFNGMTFMEDQDYRSPEHTINAVRASGIDAKYLGNVDNIVLAQGDYPADFRWRDNHNLPANRDNYNFLPEYDARPVFFKLLDNATTPWLHMHDRYWECAVAATSGSHWNARCRPIKNVNWLWETTWRVSTLNPSGFHCMRHYVLPLRYNDLLGITKGGFLIGTYGMEEYLVPFAKAFRALPAQRFNDLPGCTETVKARSLDFQGNTYFYIVNTLDKLSTASVTLSQEAVDLVSGRSVPQQLSLTLAPYQLRSFKLTGLGKISVDVKK